MAQYRYYSLIAICLCVLLFGNALPLHAQDTPGSSSTAASTTTADQLFTVEDAQAIVATEEEMPRPYIEVADSPTPLLTNADLAQGTLDPDTMLDFLDSVGHQGTYLTGFELQDLQDLMIWEYPFIRTGASMFETAEGAEEYLLGVVQRDEEGFDTEAVVFDTLDMGDGYVAYQLDLSQDGDEEWLTNIWIRRNNLLLNVFAVSYGSVAHRRDTLNDIAETLLDKADSLPDKTVPLPDEAEQTNSDDIVPNYEEALRAAAEAGDTAEVRQLYIAGADIDSVDDRDRTPLMIAAESGHDETAEALLIADAAIDLTDNDGNTALILAVAAGSQEVAEALLDAGADLDIAGDDGRTALAIAATAGDADMAQLLVDRGADVNVVDDDERTALMLATETGSIEIIDSLLDASADVDAVDLEMNTALHYAAMSGITEIMERLLAAGAAVNSTNDQGDSPFLVAAAFNAVHALPPLIDAGAIVTNTNDWGDNALQIAVSGGAAESVKALAALGLDADRPDEDGFTPLMSAAFSGDEDIVQALIEADADVNAVHPDFGDTPLLMAANFGDAETVRVLLDAGADINFADEEFGMTALMAAAGKGNVEMVHLLLGAGAAVNQLDGFGRNALMFATGSSFLAYDGNEPDLETVTALLDADANLTAAAEDGMTALDYAVMMANRGIVHALMDVIDDSNGEIPIGDYVVINAVYSEDPQIFQLVLDAGADTNATDEGGWTVLDYAVDLRTTDIVHLLLLAGAEMGSRYTANPEGIAYGSWSDMTDLMTAAYVGELAEVNALLDAGADVHIVDDWGGTALTYAAMSGNTSVIDAVLAAGAETDTANILGTTALMFAEIDTANVFGMTALMFAVEYGDAKGVASLLSAGADVAARDVDGRTALTIAQERGDPEIVEALLAAVAE